MPETYEPRQERATTLPDEPYYQLPTAPRRRGRTFVGGILLALGVVWLLGILLGGANWREGPIGAGNILFNQTYLADRLEMDVSTGDIEIRPWDGSDIKVEAIYHGGSPADYAVTIEPREGTLYVSGGPKAGFLSFGQRDIEYRISMPAGGDAQIRTMNGDIDVAELQGVVDLNSTNGDITATAIGNGLRAETINGGIELNEISGSLDLHSINGEISLSDGQVSSGTVKNTNGDIDLWGVSGALTVETVNGDVVVRLPEDSSFTLDATTISGEIDSDFELQDGRETRSTLAGTTGSGGPRLEIETISGDISITH